MRTLRGRRLTIEVNAYIPDPNDRNQHMIVNVTDISGRREAEGKLGNFIRQSTEVIVRSSGANGWTGFLSLSLGHGKASTPLRWVAAHQISGGEKTTNPGIKQYRLSRN